MTSLSLTTDELVRILVLDFRSFEKVNRSSLRRLKPMRLDQIKATPVTWVTAPACVYTILAHVSIVGHSGIVSSTNGAIKILPLKPLSISPRTYVYSTGITSDALERANESTRASRSMLLLAIISVSRSWCKDFGLLVYPTAHLTYLSATKLATILSLTSRRSVVAPSRDFPVRDVRDCYGKDTR